MERTLRPRVPVQYAVQHENDPLVTRRYDIRSKFQNQRDHGFVNHLKAADFTLQYIQENGFQQPLVFEDATELGLKVPPTSLTVRDVKSLVGARRQVDVMELHSQETHTMTMYQWTKYFETQPRQQVLNVISLEFSHTKLDPLVQPPTLVRALDWVELVWPQELKNAQNNPTNDMRHMMYPKVQKYCLMSVAGCYTDFHLDFGGTSVWYHVLWGEKLFLLIPPSPKNYATFQAWQLSGQQDVVFLGDLVPQCQLVRLRAGDTFIMPAGWIHAVYTPVDSLVFGGNFLHSFNITQQMRVAEVEEATKVPAKFLYPFYGAIHWYALLRYSQELQHMGVEAVSTVAQEGSGKVGTSKVDVVSEASSGRLCSQKWLRSVTVQRLSPIQSFSNRRKWLKCVFVERLHTVSGKENEVKLRVQSSELHSSPPIASTKPHLSRYEQKGLLTLIHAMRQENLFCCDVPSCIPTSSHLLDVLESQLRSPVLWSACSPTPTGIALIHSPLTHERKNGVKRQSKMHHSCKRVKKHKDPSCVEAELEVEHESQQTGMEVAITTEGAIVEQPSDVQLEPAFETIEQVSNQLLEGQQLVNHSEHSGSPLPAVGQVVNQIEVVCEEPLSTPASSPAALVQQSSIPAPPHQSLQTSGSQPIQFGPTIEMDLLLFIAATSTLHQLRRLVPRPAQSSSSGGSGTIWGTSPPTGSDGICGRLTSLPGKNKRKRSQPQHCTTPQSSPTKSQDESLAGTFTMAPLSLPAKPSLLSDFLLERAQWKTEVVYIDPPVEPPTVCSESTTDVLLSSEDPMLSRSYNMGGSPNKGIQVEEKTSGGTDSTEHFTNDLQSEREREPFEHDGTTDMPFGSEMLLGGGGVTPQLPFRVLGSSPCKPLEEQIALHSPCVSHNST